MPNQMDRSANEKADRQQKTTHLNDPSHRDLSAYGIQEQKGESDGDLDTFDGLRLQNRRDDQSAEKNVNEAQKEEGSKMG